MGCFDTVCALTNTIIQHHDECVLVIFRKEFDPRKEFGRREGGFISIDDVEQIVKGQYNHYGSLDGFKFDQDIRLNQVHVFFSKEAWDWAVNQIKNLVDYAGVSMAEYFTQALEHSSKYGKIDGWLSGEMLRFYKDLGATDISGVPIASLGKPPEPMKYLDEFYYVYCLMSWFLRKSPLASWAQSGQVDLEGHVKYSVGLLEITRARLQTIKACLDE